MKRGNCSPSVVLTCIEGGLRGKEFRFDEPTFCTIGRARDCLLQLPCDWAHMTISRRHCLVEIEPSHVHVRDLGSMNGTFVNGALLGCADVPGVEQETELRDGDELRLGNTAFHVHIEGLQSEEIDEDMDLEAAAGCAVCR
jgi:pSer/pThr/pTyr-binding forkhead associated (FHA) protein